MVFFGCPIEVAFPNPEKKKKKSKHDVSLKNSSDISYKTNDLELSNIYKNNNDIINTISNGRYENTLTDSNNKCNDKLIHDEKENCIINNINNDIINELKKMQEKINDLSNQVIEMKNTETKQYYNNDNINVKEKFTFIKDLDKSNTDSIVRLSDTFDDLLLYFATGLLFIFIIDYAYKLGKKSY